MKNYELILFDLDGTLIDSHQGIFSAVRYALEKMALPKLEESSLRQFVGPPLLTSFQTICHMTEEEARKGVSYYREYYTDRGLYENQLYDGVELLLIKLSNAGKSLAIATSKPEKFAKEILTDLKLTHYFSGIYGADLEGKRGEKGAVIQYALTYFPYLPVEKIVMVGDRKYDLIGAKENQLDSIGVLYGFGTEAELTTYGATYLASYPADVASLIIS